MYLTLNDFNNQVNIAIPYLRENAERLKFSETFLADLEKELEEWNKVFTPSENKATRSSTLVAERNTLRKRFEPKLNGMKKNLKSNIEVELTDADYKNLFIKIDKTPMPIPAPTTIAKVDVIGRSESTLKIQVSDPSLPDLNYTKIPKGVESINVFVAIVEANAPVPADEDYHLFISSGKSNIELKFDTKEEKKVAYIRASFVNKAGSSRMSDPINSVIPN